MGCIKSRPHVPEVLPSKTELRLIDGERIDQYSPDPTEPAQPRANETAQADEVQVYEEIPDSMVRTIWMNTSPRLDTFSLVVAIDFGTTYSAYAYAHVGEPVSIMINKNWEAAGCSGQYKTPTCLCIDDNNPTEMHSFGLHAQQCYNSPDEEDASKDVNLRMFHQFKMNLYAAKKVNREMEIFDRGESISVRAVDVFAMAMKFFKDHCLKHIGETGRDVAGDEIRWVVTVPAIWKDVQKMFMREAAVKAGLIQDTQDRNLMIALEPEAAALYCKSEYNGHSSDAPYATGTIKRASHYGSLQPGNRFLVIDAGGGTVDITAYEILESNKCKEVMSPVGGAYGGKKVNEQFERLLTNIFGKDFLHHCSKEYPSALFEMMLNFETEKRQCHDGLEKPIGVALDYSFARVFEDFSKTTLNEHFNNKTSDDGVTLSKKGKLVLSPAVLKSLFDPVVDRIVKLVGSTVMQHEELQELQKIFLVGGFGQCPYLETQLKQHLTGRKLEIVKPEEASLCVLRGAVMCGLDPELIQSRIAPRSYYIEAVGTDDSSMLSTVIDKGQSVPHDHVVIKYCEPAYHAQAYVQMNLFAADNESDKTKVCEVKVSCTAAQDQDNIVEFYFRFGGTEIAITGYHAASKTMEKTSVDFLGPQ